MQPKKLGFGTVPMSPKMAVFVFVQLLDFLHITRLTAFEINQQQHLDKS